jgi:hypothetical protein
MKSIPRSALGILLLGTVSLAAQDIAVAPASPIEINAHQGSVYTYDLLQWTGSWQAPQAIYDRGVYQDEKDRWFQASSHEGSTWNNEAPGTTYGILVVDLKATRSINQFRVFQMMDSDGKTTAVSIFMNTAFTGDDTPFADSKGWKAVVSRHPVAEGENNADHVGAPTNIDVPRFTTRYLMIHAFNDLSLVDWYIELKGIKAFDDESLNVLRGGPALIMSADAATGGTVEPAPGEHGFTVGNPTPITATAAAGFTFSGWTVAGDASVGDADSVTTTVTINSANSAQVVAHFTTPQLTPGATFEVTAAEAGMPPGASFTVNPKLYATYANPISGKAGKASAKAVGKIDKALGADPVLGLWNKKLPLYNAKSIKAAEKNGVSLGNYWDINPRRAQRDLVLDLHVAGKEVMDGDQPIQARSLTAPVILTTTLGGAGAVSAVTIEGLWFGTKPPKVWREYTVPGKYEDTIVIKRQAMKVIKPTVENSPYADSAGKPACMDPVTGDSQVMVVVPGAPKGELNGVLVLDNGVGLAVGEEPPPN